MITNDDFGNFCFQKWLSKNDPYLFALATCGQDFPVVLKISQKEGPDINRIRLLREARVMGACKHHAILEAFEIGHLPNQSAYLSMEFAEYGSLAENKEIRVSGIQAARIAHSVAEAVGHMHSNGIAHTRIMESSIFLCKEWTPKLGCLGYATPLLSDASPQALIANDIVSLGRLFARIFNDERCTFQQESIMLQCQPEIKEIIQKCVQQCRDAAIDSVLQIAKEMKYILARLEADDR